MSLQKRLAAQVLRVGEHRVWLDPTKREEIRKAVTRADIRRLVLKGYIKALPVKIRKSREKRKRKRGPGSKKGSKYAKLPRKKQWILRIRAQRRLLLLLKQKGKLDPQSYRKLYRLSKGGVFRSKAHLLLYAKQAGLLKE